MLGVAIISLGWPVPSQNAVANGVDELAKDEVPKNCTCHSSQLDVAVCSHMCCPLGTRMVRFCEFCVQRSCCRVSGARYNVPYEEEATCVLRLSDVRKLARYSSQKGNALENWMRVVLSEKQVAAQGFCPWQMVPSGRCHALQRIEQP